MALCREVAAICKAASVMKQDFLATTLPSISAWKQLPSQESDIST